jgi:hypothetical protein
VIDRASFLRLGAVSALGVLAPASMAAADGLPVPAPQGDDEGFLQFGVLAERVSLTAYRAAARRGGAWTADERSMLRTLVAQKLSHVQQLTAALGANAPAPDDFAVRLPETALRDRRGTLSLLERLEQLLVGVYVDGAAFSADAGSRLLIARLLVNDAQNLAALRALRGVRAPASLPTPIGLDAAGTQLDALLAATGYPTT